MRIKEVTGEKPFTFMLRRDDGALCESDVCDENNDNPILNKKVQEEDNSEQVWDAVDLSETGLLEIHIPARRIVVKSSIVDSDSSPQRGKGGGGGDSSAFRLITLDPCIESISKLLALTVDHVDTLLEDWFPSIGTRFVHTSEGKYLVTRLIPCPHCFPYEHFDQQNPKNDNGSVVTASGSSSKDNEKTWPSTSPGPHNTKSDIFKIFGFGIGGNRSPRMSSDSGVGNSPTNTRDSNNIIMDVLKEKESSEETMPGGILLKTGNRIEGGLGGGISLRENFSSGLNYFLRGSTEKKQVALYSWSVEYCILKTFETSNTTEEDFHSTAVVVETFKVKCPKHGDIVIQDIAPGKF
jgi:hypothetical protein